MFQDEASTLISEQVVCSDIYIKTVVEFILKSRMLQDNIDMEQLQPISRTYQYRKVRMCVHLFFCIKRRRLKFNNFEILTKFYFRYRIRVLSLEISHFFVF